MSAVTLLAPAKLNLTLHITARRPDGYHEIDSLVAFADYGDRITLELSDCLSLEVTGAFAGGLQSEPADNLMMRAAKALQAYAPGKGAHMTLIKNLPVGAGLGGGSSDAAAAIKGLTHLWNLSLPVDTVHATALSLGSDVPVCMAAQPARIQGTGDKVTPVRVQLPRWVGLVNPGKELPTANVYKGFKGAFARTENINAVYGLEYVLQR
ncbi:MAG: 4-(cytidine 5'-diphospho)-2-C-methyl-D-erythritol kinase, partial [Alphaproteobacteria bacterium]